MVAYFQSCKKERVKFDPTKGRNVWDRSCKKSNKVPKYYAAKDSRAP